MSSAELDRYIKAFEEASGSPVGPLASPEDRDLDNLAEVEDDHLRNREVNAANRSSRTQHRAMNRTKRAQKASAMPSKIPRPKVLIPTHMPREEEIEAALKRAEKSAGETQSDNSGSDDSLEPYLRSDQRDSGEGNLRLDSPASLDVFNFGDPLGNGHSKIVKAPDNSPSHDTEPSTPASAVDSLLQDFRRGLQLPGILRGGKDFKGGKYRTGNGRDTVSDPLTPDTRESAGAYSWSTAPGGTPMSRAASVVHPSSNALHVDEITPPGREILRMGAWSLSVIDSEQAQVVFTNRQTGARQGTVPSEEELGPLQRIASSAVLRHLRKSVQHAETQTETEQPATKKSTWNEDEDDGNDGYSSELSLSALQDGAMLQHGYSKIHRTKPPQKHRHAQRQDQGKSVSAATPCRKGWQMNKKDKLQNLQAQAGKQYYDDILKVAPGEEGEFDSVYLRCIEHLELLNTFSQSSVVGHDLTSSRLTIVGAEDNFNVDENDEFEPNQQSKSFFSNYSPHKVSSDPHTHPEYLKASRKFTQRDQYKDEQTMVGEYRGESDVDYNQPVRNHAIPSRSMHRHNQNSQQKQGTSRHHSNGHDGNKRFNDPVGDFEGEMAYEIEEEDVIAAEKPSARSVPAELHHQEYSLKSRGTRNPDRNDDSSDQFPPAYNDSKSLQRNEGYPQSLGNPNPGNQNSPRGIKAKYSHDENEGIEDSGEASVSPNAANANTTFLSLPRNQRPAPRPFQLQFQAGWSAGVPMEAIERVPTAPSPALRENPRTLNYPSYHDYELIVDSTKDDKNAQTYHQDRSNYPADPVMEDEVNDDLRNTLHTNMLNTVYINNRENGHQRGAIKDSMRREKQQGNHNQNRNALRRSRSAQSVLAASQGSGLSVLHAGLPQHLWDE